MKQIYWLGFSLLTACLSGCGSVMQFDVPPEKGLRGVSVAEVDRISKQGKLPSGNTNKIEKHNNQVIDFDASALPFTKTAMEASPLRTHEVVLQMWIAPYESQGGIYFQPSFVNVVVKPSQWLPPIVDDLTFRE